MSKIISYEQLITSGRNGHPEAIDTLMERLAADKTYYNMALRILQHQQDTEDAIQDSLLLVYRRWSQYKGDAKFATWYGRIVINCALMKLRANTRTKIDHVVPDLYDPAPSMDQQMIDEERSDVLVNAIDTLPDSVGRSATLLYVEQDMSIREVATELGIPYSSAKSAIQRTRRKLKKKLEVKLK